MKFNILLVLATLAVQVFTASKLRKFPVICFPMGAGGQQVNMRNTANSNTSALAVNSAFCGDATAFSMGSAGNYNQVSQQSTPVCIAVTPAAC